MSDQYISVKVPAMGSISVKTIKLVVRSDEGETLASGNVAMQFDARSGDELVIMSPDMVTAVFGHPTMQRLYERHEDRAERILEEMDEVEEDCDGAKLGELLNQSEIADLIALDGSEFIEAKEVGYSIFRDAIHGTRVTQAVEEESNKGFIADPLVMISQRMTEDNEKRTPDEWCARYGALIADPDGWREPNALAWDEPITLVDFHERVSRSTARVMGRTRLANDVANLKRRRDI